MKIFGSITFHAFSSIFIADNLSMIHPFIPGIIWIQCRFVAYPMLELKFIQAETE
jgi:hypothetical protein